MKSKTARAPIALTNAQARRFVLEWQGLCGPRRFAGPEGVLEFARHAGCVQFDPVNVCGRSADITLFSRVEGYRTGWLEDLLYKQRSLMDHWDKNMSITPVEDWPFFSRTRDYFRGWSYENESLAKVEAAKAQVRERFQRAECLCSGELGLNEKIAWPWGSAPLGRAVLETLYFQGELCVHHRDGVVRHYAPAQSLLPAGLLAQPSPHETEEEYHAWHLLRRIGAVALAPEGGSDAWLAIPHLDAEKRRAAFELLRQREEILPVQVDGLKTLLYTPARALPTLGKAKRLEEREPRLEFIAPLDSFIWDRKLIRSLFGFAYTWEVYTPAAKRKYGPYTLPVLYGDRFAGRIQMTADRKNHNMAVNGWWREPDFPRTKGFTPALRKQIGRFARFQGCKNVEYTPCCGL